MKVAPIQVLPFNCYFLICCAAVGLVIFLPSIEPFLLTSITEDISSLQQHNAPWAAPKSFRSPLQSKYFSGNKCRYLETKEWHGRQSQTSLYNKKKNNADDFEVSITKKSSTEENQKLISTFKRTRRSFLQRSFSVLSFLAVISDPLLDTTSGLANAATSKEKEKKTFSNEKDIINPDDYLDPSDPINKEPLVLNVYPNERIYDTKRHTYLSTEDENLTHSKILKEQPIICVGEIHNDNFHHRAEFQIVKAIHYAMLENKGKQVLAKQNEEIKKKAGANPMYMATANAATLGEDFFASVDDTQEELYIGMEMFYRKHQPILDNYIFGDGTLQSLREDTKWDTTWGHKLSYYAKLLQYCKYHKIRIIGLNIPVPVVQVVRRIGLNSLPQELATNLPEIDLSNKKHRKRFMDIMEMFGGVHGSLPPGALDRLYEAQTLWDEYMAESVAQVYEDYYKESQNQKNKSPKKRLKLVALAGSAHIQNRDGVPERITKRIGKDVFTVVPVTVKFEKETGLPSVQKPEDQSFADWVWYTQSPRA